MTSPDPKTVIDTTIATGMISTPIWLQWVEQGLQIFMLVGGAALLIMRLWIMYNEFKNRKENKDS
tara:strand:+ start:379 stop:573 length:195 start_codon:yes stop_codon:yes gene_type:complete